MDDDNLDVMLRRAAPVTAEAGDVARLARALVATTETRCRRRRASRLAGVAVVAATVGLSGAALAAEGPSVPGWISSFGYDAHRAYVDEDGGTCHEALLVSPFVRDDDPDPPTDEEVRRAVAVARSVAADFDLDAVQGAISRPRLMELVAAIDAELRRHGLPEAYAIGAMGECATPGAS